MDYVPRGPVDFVILTALEEERNALLSKLPSPRKLPPSSNDNRVYYWCELPSTFADGVDCKYKLIVLCLPKMGRIDAANALNDAIRAWNPLYVILAGIAGGIAGGDITYGDVLIGDQVVDYELQKVLPSGPEVRYEVHRADQRLLEAARNFTDTAWQERIGIDRPEAGKPTRHIGPMLTGDKVIAVNELLTKYRDAWPKIIGMEMEAGGAALAAFQAANRPGFFMVRAVSDLGEGKDKAEVKKWRSYACDVAAAYTVGLLTSGPVPPQAMPARMTGSAFALRASRDDISVEMMHITFAEVQVITSYIIDQPSRPGTSFENTDIAEKLARNGLSSRIHDYLTLGLSKVRLVGEYIEHMSTLDSRFPERVKAGFFNEYNRLTRDGVRQDDLFDGLLKFATNGSQELIRQAAALAVLTYLFEKCEVFEK
jgi:nucleoside phosphorylase